MPRIAIRPLNSARHVVLDEQYSLEDVEAMIQRAIIDGQHAVIFDGDRDGKVVVSVSGTEPFTIRELSDRPSGGSVLA